MKGKQVTSGVTQGSQKKKVLLADDHPLMRRGLAHLINLQAELEVCGESSDAVESMRLIESLKPDLLVMGLSLDGKNGLEFIKDLQALHPELPVLVNSTHDESLYAERVLRSGARGYVMKKEDGAVVLLAIRRVLSGRIYVSEAMSMQILTVFAGARSAAGNSPIGSLSDREFEIFELIGQGCVTQEIARRLHISPKTVDAHRQNLKQKLKLPSGTTLIQNAVRWVENRDQN